MGAVKVTIDGITVEVPANYTILKAAEEAEIEIPYFCYHPYLKPAGLCRMCLVEVEGLPKLVPACVTQVRDGMVVFTRSDKVKKAQEGLIEFQLLHHPLDCPICDQAGECALQDITFKYGKATSRFIEEKELYPTKFYGPLIVHEQSRCILCKRCVRFGTEVLGGVDWNVYWRAAHSIIGAYERDVVADYFTCNMVEICPVGAITSRLYRYKTRIWKLEFKNSLCANCELACSVNLGVRENRLYKVKHEDPEPSPWICDKAYYAFDYINHSERILWPLKREADKMVSESSKDIVVEIAEKLSRYSGEEVALIVSPVFSLEDARKIKSFALSLNCNNVDYRIYGEDYLPIEGSLFSLSELESASSIVVLAGDIAVSHPVLSLSVLKAKLSGAKVAVVSSFDSFVGERSTEFLVPLPFSEEECIKSLFEGDYSEGFGVDKDEYERAKSIIEDAQVIIVGTRASASLRAFIKEKVSHQKKVLFLNNGQNARAFYKVGFFSQGVGEILSNVCKGKIKALLVFGADLFQTYPDWELVRKAFENLELLVVGDLFFTDSASYADYFLPLTSFAESEGTIIDIFGIEKKRKQALSPEGETKTLSEWVDLIADAGSISLSSFDTLNGMWEPVGVEREKISGDGYQALVVYPFYRSALYSNWCSNFSGVCTEPKAFLSFYDAKELGLSEGDLVIVEGSSKKFEYRVSVKEWLPKGSCVLEGGFDRFPVNMLLKGSFLSTVKIKKA